jgi:hypothetical protein
VKSLRSATLDLILAIALGLFLWVLALLIALPAEAWTRGGGGHHGGGGGVHPGPGFHGGSSGHRSGRSFQGFGGMRSLAPFGRSFAPFWTVSPVAPRVIYAPTTIYSVYAPVYYQQAPVSVSPPVEAEIALVPLIPPPPPGPPGFWYYCEHAWGGESAGAYYPYVWTCPAGWRAVVPPGRS